MKRMTSSRKTLRVLSVAVAFAAFLTSAAVPARADGGTPAASHDIAGYDKGFFIRAPDAPYLLKLQGRLQARFAYEALEGADDEMAFSIPRARLTAAGHVFTEALTWKLQLDFGKGSATLKDFYADYALVPKWLHLRAGQWKRPFSRQQITSSGKLELTDRAITDKFFGAGRDIGVAIHNDYEHSPAFEYAFGVFNGTGEKPWFEGNVTVDPATGEGDVAHGGFTNVPDRFRPALVLRLGYNYGGIKGYSEADLEGGPLRFAVGASGLADLDLDEDDASRIVGELDFLLKVSGFSVSGAAYVASKQAGGGFVDQSYAALGFHVQAGYVLSGFVEPVVRYAMTAPDGSDNDVQEILGGVSLYLFGHDVKWQIEGGALLSESAGGDRTDGIVRTQLQLAF